jgi:hypothetical protein
MRGRWESEGWQLMLGYGDWALRVEKIKNAYREHDQIGLVEMLDSLE